MNDKNKKKTIITSSILVLVIIILVISISYAVFMFSKLGEKENKITTGTLILTLDESATNGIAISNAVPVSDSDGQLGEAYTFTLKNTGTLNSNYRLSIVHDEAKYAAHGCASKKMSWTDIKYSFTKNAGIATTTLLSTDNGRLDTGFMVPSDMNTYTIRLWIKDTADNSVMGKHFHGKVQIQGIQEGHTNYETGE